MEADPESSSASIHDRFFKEAFSRKRPAVEFFQAYLPPAIVGQVDWDQLRLESGSFVDESLRGHSSDLLLEQLRGELLLRTILSLMKAVREGVAGEWLERCVEPLEQLFADESDSALLRTLFLYLCRTGSNVTYATVEKVIEQTRTPTIRQNIMTIEEELRQRGLAEGRQQGQQEGRREGRQEGRQEGLLLGQIQACQRMLDQPASVVRPIYCNICGEDFWMKTRRERRAYPNGYVRSEQRSIHPKRLPPGGLSHIWAVASLLVGFSSIWEMRPPRA